MNVTEKMIFFYHYKFLIFQMVTLKVRRKTPKSEIELNQEAFCLAA